MTQCSLLLIDDDINWLNSTAAFFKTKKYTVYTAPTGLEGVKLAHQHVPDCILLDYTLPDMDGGMVAICVRNEPDLWDIPIVMITGDASKELPAHYEYKADSFVLKGEPLTKTMAVVESLVRRVRWERGITKKDDLCLCGKTLCVLRNLKPVATLSADQFCLFLQLVKKSPAVVSKEELCQYVFGPKCEDDKEDALKLLVYRLRQRLGRQLGFRIKSVKNIGWTYLSPRRLRSDSASSIAE